MKLLKIKTTNFRNLKDNFVFEFCDNINCLYGNNGNGKTNLLESIHVLFKRKSFRKNTTFKEYVNLGNNNLTISSLIDIDSKKLTYSAKINEDEFNYYVNGITKEKINYSIIFVSPFDSYSFFYTPKIRRTWFDQCISNICSEYKISLRKYNNLLKNRNILLKKRPDYFLQQIKSIDPLLAKEGYKVTKKREKFLLELHDFFPLIFKKLFSSEHNLFVKLDTKGPRSSTESILKELDDNIRHDLLANRTIKGVHKDDYLFQLNSLNLHKFCSTGQQKISYLSLVFAYIELFRYKFETLPMIIIDDISGEIDYMRWEHMVRYLNEIKSQIFISTTNEIFMDKLNNIENIFKLEISNGFLTSLEK